MFISSLIIIKELGLKLENHSTLESENFDYNLEIRI